MAQPLPDTADRVESPLKYLSLWGAQRVNVNTAPRHVLEATFALAMDSFDIPEFTQEVIELRKEKPFRNIDDLKEAVSLLFALLKHWRLMVLGLILVLVHQQRQRVWL